MSSVSFDVLGTPRPQGSKKAIAVGGKAIMKESSDTHAMWRNQVAQMAKEIADTLPEAPLHGPLVLRVQFRFQMPVSRPKKVRALGSTPKLTAPDTSKLVRNLEDGLQAGGLIVDDARIVTILASKIETTEWTGAAVHLAWGPEAWVL